MFTLLIIALLLAIGLYLLFRYHLVKLTNLHLLLHSQATALRNDVAALRQWLAEHAHLQTAPPAASPAGQEASKSTS